MATANQLTSTKKFCITSIQLGKTSYFNIIKNHLFVKISLIDTY
jgi:hypothetical protein